MPRNVTDCKRIVIYKIVCNALSVTNVYVGHTVDLIKRKSCHKSRCNNENSKSHNLKLYKNIRENGGWENWSVIKICDYPCNSKEEARTEERRYYELLNSDLNMIRPLTTEEEYREQLNENQKIYYVDNRNKVIEKAKKYYEANKTKILERAETKKQQKKEYNKNYYANTKAVTLQRLKQKYTCECGSCVTISGKFKHLKTLKHIKFVETQNEIISVNYLSVSENDSETVETEPEPEPEPCNSDSETDSNNSETDSNNSDTLYKNQNHLIFNRYVYIYCACKVFYREKKILRTCLNMYYNTNPKYQEFLKINQVERIDIVKPLHKGFTDGEHFNVIFISLVNPKLKYTVYHVYLVYDCDGNMFLSNLTCVSNPFE